MSINSKTLLPTFMSVTLLSLVATVASTQGTGPQQVPPLGDEAAAPSGSLGAPPSAPSGGEVKLKPGKAPAPGDKPASKGTPIPGQYIVTFSSSSAQASIQKSGMEARSVAAIIKAKPIYVYENALAGFVAKLNDEQLKILRNNKAVKAIEQDQTVIADAYVTQKINATTGQPWGLDRIDQQSSFDRTYTYWSNAGAGVRVYIIDTGIATAHPDFGGRASNVFDAFGGSGQDCNGHGTHVAGTVGGKKYGVAKRVTLLGVRVLGQPGIACSKGTGTNSGIIAGIDWVRRNAIRPAVVNMSLGGGYSLALNTATTNLINSGVFVAVAAGNNNANACNASPASASGTVTVAAADWYDTRANQSNTANAALNLGPWASNYGPCVDLYAPGVFVQSTWLNGGTNIISGTSMATPHVAGVAALLKGDYGDQTSPTIASWILGATRPNMIKSNVTGTPNRLLYMKGW